MTLSSSRGSLATLLILIIFLFSSIDNLLSSLWAFWFRLFFSLYWTRVDFEALEFNFLLEFLFLISLLFEDETPFLVIIFCHLWTYSFIYWCILHQQCVLHDSNNVWMTEYMNRWLFIFIKVWCCIWVKVLKRYAKENLL